MRGLGLLLAVLGLVIMGVAYFSSSYDHRDELTVLHLKLDRALRAARSNEVAASDEIPEDVYNPERAQRRQFGFMGGAALFVVGGIFIGFGWRRREDDPTSAPATPPASPPAA